MEAPSVTCRGLYNFDKNLRLCWLNKDFEGSGEGCFGVVELRPWSRVENSEGNRRSVQPVFQWPEVRYAGPIYSRKGSALSDFDPITQAPVLLFTVSPQWNMHTRDVFGSRLVGVMERSRKTRREHYLQQREEIIQKAKDTQANATGVAHEMADGIMHARKHHAGERVVMARKHWKEYKAAQDRKRASKLRRGIVGSRLFGAGHY